jgi:hypothetical protein
VATKKENCVQNLQLIPVNPKHNSNFTAFQLTFGSILYDNGQFMFSLQLVHLNVSDSACRVVSYLPSGKTVFLLIMWVHHPCIALQINVLCFKAVFI